MFEGAQFDEHDAYRFLKAVESIAESLEYLATCQCGKRNLPGTHRIHTPCSFAPSKPEE